MPAGGQGGQQRRVNEREPEHASSLAAKIPVIAKTLVPLAVPGSSQS
jgi:hypothetical protein